MDGIINIKSQWSLKYGPTHKYIELFDVFHEVMLLKWVHNQWIHWRKQPVSLINGVSRVRMLKRS